MHTDNPHRWLAPAGAWPVVPTPFADCGPPTIQAQTLRAIIRRLAHTDIAGLWILGVGAEQSTLTDTEMDLISQVVLTQAPNLPIAAGVTAADVSVMTVRARRFTDQGCSFVFALEPGSHASTPETTVARMRALTDTGVPTFAYLDTTTWEDHASTSSDIISALAPLWDLPLAGVKLACQDFRIWAELCQHAQLLGVPVYTASGRLTLPALALGASGVIADDVTIAPEHYAALITAWQNTDLFQARTLQSILLALGRAISQVPVAGAKYALHRQGLGNTRTRIPANLSAHIYDDIRTTLKTLETGPALQELWSHDESTGRTHDGAS